MSKQITVPGSEILAAQEKYFNRSVEIANKHASNPYKQLQELHTMIREMYVKAYESGFRQCELEGITGNTIGGPFKMPEIPKMPKTGEPVILDGSAYCLTCGRKH